jgi:hypothetical protein
VLFGIINAVCWHAEMFLVAGLDSECWRCSWVIGAATGESSVAVDPNLIWHSTGGS